MCRRGLDQGVMTAQTLRRNVVPGGGGQETSFLLSVGKEFQNEQELCRVAALEAPSTRGSDCNCSSMYWLKNQIPF